MRIVLATVRGSRTPWADEAAQDYGKRIGRYFPFEEVVLKAASADDAATRLTALVPARGWLIALDERGADLDSLGFARLLTEAADQGVTSLVYAIGGAYGHAPSVRAKARAVVRMSTLVLNHAVARVLLYEQLYRACTIRAGEPYHHA